MQNKYKNVRWLLFSGVFWVSNAIAHSLPDFDSMIVMAKVSVNYMPKMLSQYCADEDQEIHRRIHNLSGFLSKKLTIDEICDHECVNENKNGITREHAAQMLAQYDNLNVDKNERVCSRYLNFLEEQQRKHRKSLADLVKAKNTNAPDVIYELNVVTTPVWNSNGDPNAIGKLASSVINLNLHYRSYYHQAIETGIYDPPDKYSFLISLHRNQTDKNLLPMDIQVKDIRLKVNGKDYVAKLTSRSQSGCCNSEEVLASFDYIGQLGKEPFSLEILGVNDAGIEFPPLIYESIHKPAGLLKAPRVLQELIMMQWQRN